MPLISHDKLFIGGEWVRSTGSGTIDVISPFTEEVLGRVPDATAEDIDRAVASARKAFDQGPWPRMSIDERADCLQRMMAALEPRLAELVELQVREMGGPRKFFQPITMAHGRHLRSAIETAKAVPLNEVRNGSNGKVWVRREPIGVIGAIIPWNGPVVMLLQELMPALLTGCPVIIKPAPESPLSAYLVCDALAEAGLPPGVVSIIAGGREVGEHLVSHPGVDKIDFTGSVLSGRRVGSICGSQIKPVTLELGGKSASIVLDDVDLDKELPSLLGSAMPNNGQACVATTRILVSANRYDEVVDRLVAATRRLKIGNPLDEDTDVGPLVSANQRKRVEGYIQIGREEGARLVCGGGRPAFEKGWFVEPTIFADVDNGMRIAQEEIFGPVVAVIRYKTQEEAIRIANDSAYGLGGAVFTSDMERGMAVASKIRTGTCVINCAKAGTGSPLGGYKQAGGGGPFGGFKQSGVGRRNGTEGIESYYQLSSVVMPPGFEPSIG